MMQARRPSGIWRHVPIPLATSCPAAMYFEQLLDGFPKAEFIQQVFRHQPLARRGVQGPWLSWGSWDTVAAILDEPQADVLVARSGKLWPGGEPLTYELARELHADGYTIAIRHAERYYPPLAEVAREFAELFCGEINIHLYCTPERQHGFGWHYDAEDVFIIQTAGTKQYSLRKNTVNPWPVEETMPLDMQFEREISPLMKCQLAAGDWLYIPAGYWHVAQAGEAAVSLALGIETPSALNLLDHLRHELLNDLRWRQRLPVLGEGSTLSPQELQAELAALVEGLSADLQQRLADPAFLGRFLSAIRQVRHGGDETASPDVPT